jgi:hypothetical protein
MVINTQQREIVRRCQDSCIWFASNFVKIKHPAAGIIPYQPWSYQRKAIKAFREHRMNIFRKTRQAGASKTSGIFALWFAMMHNHKTVLIVSRTDPDAKKFLEENIKLPYSHLPEWMKEMWKPVVDNAHELVFPNGSSIRSLTSNPDVLRSNASSLNIIDEAAFIPNMDIMWAGGWPTLQHGGSIIVISTTNGVGNWYWSTWTDAETKANQFNPILINWWDMDWRVEYDDSLTRRKKIIEPTAGIRKCTSKEEIEKYGPYWSPWLEDQYQALQERGEAWKFDQEVLAEFVGSGNTVVSKSVLVHVESTSSDEYERIVGQHPYVHPVTGDSEVMDLDQELQSEGLWIWKRPVRATPDRVVGGRIIEKGQKAHSYVMGVDLATGKGKDYHGVEILDLDTREQVAEAMFHCLPREFKKIVDRIGRMYNSALAVVERNNGGDTFIDDLRLELMYPRIWRKITPNDRPSSGKGPKASYAHHGFFTGQASKPILNKLLIDFIRDSDDEGGFKIYSKRLLKQLTIYVRKKNRMGHDTGRTEAEDGPGNFDDLVMALGLALVGVTDGYNIDPSNLMPVKNQDELSAGLPMIPSVVAYAQGYPGQLVKTNDAELMEKAGPHAYLVPMKHGGDTQVEMVALAELDRFAAQLAAGKPKDLSLLPAVVHRKHVL